MGSILHFVEVARACKMAQELASRGYGVIWECTAHVLTAADRHAVREISNETEGIVPNWYEQPHIETDTIDAHHLFAPWLPHDCRKETP